MNTTLTRFVSSESIPATAALVPEVRLHLARDSHAIFSDAERFHEQNPTIPAFPPYWAFAWPGGQAMARFLLDTPEIVEGRHIIDVGAGSGIAAIAALKAGAARVCAVDVDPLAVAAITLNAGLNGITEHLETTTEDCLADIPDADLVLISDLVYEPELAVRVGAFIERARSAGLPVIMGDRMSAHRPARGFVEVARYDAPLAPALQEDEAEQGRIWQARPHPRETPPGSRDKMAR